MTSDDLEALVRRHVAETWQGDAEQASGQLLESFGIDPADMALVAAWHVDSVTQDVSPKAAAVAAFYGGAMLGLWLAREIESNGLRVEAEYWNDAATSYGRALQAVIAGMGGELRIPISDYRDDLVMLTSEIDGDDVVLKAEETVDGSEG